MSGEKIIRGLKEAVAVARGEDQPARVHVKPAGQTQGLVERLEAPKRVLGSGYGCQNCDDDLKAEAAQMIRSLASRNEGLEEALRPFAERAAAWDDRDAEEHPIQHTNFSDERVVCLSDGVGTLDRHDLSVGDFRKARQALSPEEGGCAPPANQESPK